MNKQPASFSEVPAQQSSQDNFTGITHIQPVSMVINGIAPLTISLPPSLYVLEELFQQR